MALNAPSPSPAPAARQSDLKYTMACIKHNSTKLTPVFDEVTKETGKKDRTAARLALNAILRKWGISQGQKSTVEDTTGSPATPKGANKRGRPEKTTNREVEGADTAQDDAEETPSKKAKVAKNNREEDANRGED